MKFQDLFLSPVKQQKKVFFRFFLSHILPSYLQTGFDLYGRFPDTVCADSGYGSEQNYEVMDQMGIEAFVKYNWFYKEQHRPFKV